MAFIWFLIALDRPRQDVDHECRHAIDDRADVLNDEVIAALEPFFDWIGPTHDELTRVFDRLRVSRFDPDQYEDAVAKRRRVRVVLSRALEADPAAGDELVKHLIDLIRSKDGFVPGTEHHPGRRAVDRLRAALARTAMRCHRMATFKRPRSKA